MNPPTRILISLGSNYNPIENIEFAKKKLKAIFGETTKFTDNMWTTPIDIESNRFINCICMAETRHKLLQLEMAFKRLEKQCNRSKKNDSMKRIPLDIDVLLYGDEKRHKKDWDRDYIKVLLKQIDDEEFIIDPTL